MAEGIGALWTCPCCFSLIEAAGPAALRLAVADHIRAHERAARRAAVAECGLDCQKLMGTNQFCAARKKNEKGLTPFDEQFLISLKVAWDPPVKAEDLK